MSLYGITQDTPESTGSAPLAGNQVHLVTLDRVTYEPTKEGSNNYALAFHFVSDAGESLRHLEFPIDAEETKKRAHAAGQDPAKAVEKRAQSQGIRIKHILTKLVEAKYVKIPVSNTFEEYAKNISTFVTRVYSKFPKPKLWLKVMVNKSGYATLPPYTPFVEVWTEGKPTTLSFTAKETQENMAYLAAATRSQGGGQPGAPANTAPAGMPDDDDLFGEGPTAPTPRAQAPAPTPAPAPQAAQQPAAQPQAQAPQQPNTDGPGLDGLDDDLPF